jgi:hypothetical protein
MKLAPSSEADCYIRLCKSSENPQALLGATDATAAPYHPAQVVLRSIHNQPCSFIEKLGISNQLSPCQQQQHQQSLHRRVAPNDDVEGFVIALTETLDCCNTNRVLLQSYNVVAAKAQAQAQAGRRSKVSLEVEKVKEVERIVAKPNSADDVGMDDLDEEEWCIVEKSHCSVI